MVAPWACSLPDKIIYAGPGGYFPAERQEIMRYGEQQAAKLQKADMAARAALIKAEKDLVAWALSIVPTGIRATLAPAAETDHATRKKIIDLAMRLDASTVSHRVV